MSRTDRAVCSAHRIKADGSVTLDDDFVMPIRHLRLTLTQKAQNRPASLYGLLEERMNRGVRVALVALGAVVAGVLIAYYVVGYLLVTPPTSSPASGGPGPANLTLHTVAALGAVD